MVTTVMESFIESQSMLQKLLLVIDQVSPDRCGSRFRLADMNENIFHSLDE